MQPLPGGERATFTQVPVGMPRENSGNVILLLFSAFKRQIDVQQVLHTWSLTWKLLENDGWERKTFIFPFWDPESLTFQEQTLFKFSESKEWYFFSAQLQKNKMSKRPIQKQTKKSIMFVSLIPWNLVTPFSNKTHGPWDPWIHRIHQHATRWEFACTLSCSPRWLEGLGGILFPPPKKKMEPKVSL